MKFRTTTQQTMKGTIVTSMIIGVSYFSLANKISREDYIEQWKDIAVNEMFEHKIPASITLAQGILESGSGNSILAQEGNNHFGIKCHGWEGGQMFLDDDEKGECFRMYPNAEESYKDHSEFLMKHDRYAGLFAYDHTDYKSWAKGLKEAGYATNPKYADLLIKLIEDLGLDQYDAYSEMHISTDAIADNKSNAKNAKSGSVQHNIFVHTNKVKYVIAQKGDTYYRISKEFGLTLRQLYRYNSFDAQKDVLEEGETVYIMPKRKGSIFKQEIVEADEEMSIHEISQKYAVSEKSIRRLNHFTENFLVSKGEIITLR